MARRLTLHGANEHDATHLKNLLSEAPTGVRTAWRFYSGDDTDLLVVDVDTVYGHMDWLRVHNQGTPVAVLTEHVKFEDSELILHKPVSLENLTQVLAQVAEQVPDRAESADVEDKVAKPIKPIVANNKVSAKSTPAPAPIPEPAPPAASPTPEPLSEQSLEQWLSGSSLSGQVRVRHVGAPDLIIDNAEKTFYTDSSLRALEAHCKSKIKPDEWQHLTPADFTAVKSNSKAQPITRLLWLCHILGSHGHPAPGMDINGRHKLARWPQIEREFPKHFRIATVMMKQPATLSEVAEQSGATLPDVIDFANAYNAIGYLESEADANADSAARDTGRGAILSRLRKPFGNG